MKIIALTGAIASGKNFIADILAKKLQCEIFDADNEVHKIYQEDQKIINKVKAIFPKSFKDNKIDRAIISQEIFKKPQYLKDLEQIIHPQVRKNYQKFLSNQKKKNAKFIILNIPLLIEKSGYEYDELVAITIYPSTQKRRLISRAKARSNFDENLLEKKFKEISKRQLNNKERKQIADFVINNSFSKEKTILQINKYIKLLNK